jgi:hypothetical protein
MLRLIGVLFFFQVTCFAGLIHQVDYELKGRFNSRRVVEFVNLLVSKKALGNDEYLPIIEDQVEFFDLWKTRYTRQAILVHGAHPLFIKLSRSRAEQKNLEALLLDQSIMDYQIESRVSQDLPALILPLYLCEVKKSRVKNVSIFPLAPGKHLAAYLVDYRNAEISAEDLGLVFFEVGKAFAYFQKFFMTEDGLTREHGDPMLYNFIVSDDLKVSFVDLETMHTHSELKPPSDEIHAFLSTSVKRYFRWRLEKKDLEAFEIFLSAFCRGYLEVFDLTSYPEVYNTVVKDLSRISYRIHEQGSIIQRVKSSLEKGL